MSEARRLVQFSQSQLDAELLQDPWAGPIVLGSKAQSAEVAATERAQSPIVKHERGMLITRCN